MKYIFIFIFMVMVISSCQKSKVSLDDIVIDNTPEVISVDYEKTPVKNKYNDVDIKKYNLVDVTNSEEIRGIKTSDTKGYAKAAFKNNVYSLAGVFENLPLTQDGDFYEGWVVQADPLKFISTGKVENKNGIWVNIFTSNTDYSNYKNYVLTLEPDDGNPDPADHILEGILEF